MTNSIPATTTRKKRKARHIGDASKHTIVIDSPVSMWSKLAWDIDVFRDIQGSYPEEKQPLAFAAINACIAAWSLRNWVESFTARKMRNLGVKFDREAFCASVAKAVPGQAMCEAIANTAKHAYLGEGQWPGGKVEIDYQEGDEDCPPGFVVYHLTEDGSSAGLAINNLIELCNDWWTYLNQHGFTNGEARVPEWQQNKLNRIFGHVTNLPKPTN